MYSQSKTSINLVHICLLISLSFIQFSLSQTDTHKPIYLGDTIPEITIKKNKTYNYFKLQIGDDYVEGNDIIIKVIPLDYDSDPDIFISTENKNPTNSSNSEWACGSYGKDTCSIHHDAIDVGDTFYIGALCYLGHCKFQLKVIQTNEFWLDNGVDFQTSFDSEEAKVFKFLLPSASDSNSSLSSSFLDRNTHPDLIIKASAYRSDAHDFTVMASIQCPSSSNNESLPSSDFKSKKGVSAWKKGQVIRIGRNEFPQQNWEGCIIDIVMDVVDSGDYHIMAQTKDAIPQLYNQQQVDDIVKFEELQCYRYYVRDENANFQLFLTTYSGRVDVGITPESDSLTSFNDFVVKRENQNEAIIDIRRGMRRHVLNQMTGMFLICVKGVLTSTYSLKVREFQEQERTIQDGFSEQFFMGRRHHKVVTHIYKVPKLDYAEEDMRIDATVVIKWGGNHGTNGSLALFGRLCMNEETHETCRSNALSELDRNDMTQLRKGMEGATGLFLSIDHDEDYCHNVLNENCFYVFIVQNPDENANHVLYEMLVTHSQNNHLQLKEHKIQYGSVEQHQFKYYKFTLATEDPTIEQLKFEVLPVHGDSDIYVSRWNQFPDKTDYEKRSMKVGSQGDFAEYCFCDKNLTTLVGTYYIGVYGYTYATFGLLVIMNRTNHSKTENLKAKTVHLYENIPLTKSLHNELDIFFGYFDIDMADEVEDREIQIFVQNLEQKTHTFVSLNRVPQILNYDFQLIDGVLTIPPTHAKYTKEGTYYIMVVPYFGFVDLFVDNYYKFSLVWKMENAIQLLHAGTPTENQIAANSYIYFKHYILDADGAIKISLLTNGGGQQDIVVSATPTNSQPTLENYDFTTKFQTGGNFSHGKSLYLKGLLLQTMNPSCLDLGYAEENPCVLYIGVYCREQAGCLSKIDLEYENNRPKKLVVGQTKHSTIVEGSYSYYYISISPKQEVEDIYAVVQPLYGEVDLVASLVSASVDINDWPLPTYDEYEFESKTKLKTDVILIPQQKLKECFQLASPQADCVVIFGIVAPASSENKEGGQLNETDSTDSQQAYFNFVVYKNVMELKSGQSGTGYVKQGEYSYFIFQSKCKECPLSFTLSSYSNGNPDLFIVKNDIGSNRLPSITEYDFKKATFNSEILNLNLNSTFKNGSKIESLDGYYILGVYGNINTSFSLAVTGLNVDLTTLNDGLPVKNMQTANTIIYYQYYNWNDLDIEIELSVLQGNADIYINPYHSSQNLNQSLPISKEKSTWHVYDINPISQGEQEKEMIILQEDRYYCKNCIYLIGVKASTSQLQYSLVVRNVDAEKNYAHLMKMGETKMVKIKEKNAMQIYQFMIETRDPFTITPAILQGQATFYLSFEESPEYSFMSSLGEVMKVNRLDSYLRTETNYYLIVQCKSDGCDLSITLHQRYSVINLHDGIPQQIYFSDLQDANKFMTFPLSEGNSTVIISVKSKTQGFFPILYSHIFTYDELAQYNSKSQSSIIFPPNDQISYAALGSSSLDWDKEMFVMKHAFYFEGLKKDVAGLALNLAYHIDPIFEENSTNPIQKNDTSALAVITISKSQMVKLMPNVEYYGDLQYTTSFSTFLVSPIPNQHVFVSFSQCMGFSKVSILDGTIKIPLNFTDNQGVSITTIKNQNKPFFLIVEPVTFLDQYYDGTKREFLIKIHHMTEQEHLEKMVYYTPRDGGNIKFDILPSKKERSVKLSWGPLYQAQGHQSRSEEKVKNVKYIMVASKNPNARLDQVCAIKKRADTFYEVDRVSDQTSHVVSSLEPGREIYFNIIAVSDENQVSIPYKPITLYLPRHDQKNLGHLMFLLLLIIILLIFGMIYFYTRSRSLKHKLAEEVREIISSSGTKNVEPTVSKYNKIGGGSSGIDEEGIGSTKKGGYGKMSSE